MSLTGRSFQWLTIAIDVLVTFAVLALWNKVHGRRTLRLTGRVGLLTAAYLAAAVAILVSINIAYGGLIATWGDLFDNLQPPHGTGNNHHQPPATSPPPRRAKS